jgi:hypothetical protein
MPRLERVQEIEVNIGKARATWARPAIMWSANMRLCAGLPAASGQFSASLRLPTVRKGPLWSAGRLDRFDL